MTRPMTRQARMRGVQIVDDNMRGRMMLRAPVAFDGRLGVAGAAGDPSEARQKIKDLNPDALTPGCRDATHEQVGVH